MVVRGSGCHGNSRQQPGDLRNMMALHSGARGKGPGLAARGQECEEGVGREGLAFKAPLPATASLLLFSFS